MSNRVNVSIALYVETRKQRAPATRETLFIGFSRIEKSRITASGREQPYHRCQEVRHRQEGIEGDGIDEMAEQMVWGMYSCLYLQTWADNKAPGLIIYLLLIRLLPGHSES